MNGIGLDNNFSDDVREERELIRKVQLTDDKIAMNKLIKLYRGTINNCIMGSGVYQVMDRETAERHAVNIFKDIIKRKFDLNYANKPITPITVWLKTGLQKVKEDNRSVIGKKSSELSRKDATINSNFKEILERQLDREPTSQELFKFIKNNTVYAKDLEIKNIDRINKMKRRDLSGDQIINAGPDSSAEKITVFDVLDQDPRSTEEVFDDYTKRRRIEKILASGKYSREERKLIRQYLGLGEFSGRRSKNLNQAAINSNLTYQQAQNAIKKIRKELEEL